MISPRHNPPGPRVSAARGGAPIVGLTLAEENSIYRDGLATAVEAGEMTAKEAIDQYAADVASEDAARRAQGLYLGDQ